MPSVEIYIITVLRGVSSNEALGYRYDSATSATIEVDDRLRGAYDVANTK